VLQPRGEPSWTKTGLFTDLADSDAFNCRLAAFRVVCTPHISRHALNLQVSVRAFARYAPKIRDGYIGVDKGRINV